MSYDDFLGGEGWWCGSERKRRAIKNGHQDELGERSDSSPLCVRERKRKKPAHAHSHTHASFLDIYISFDSIEIERRKREPV